MGTGSGVVAVRGVVKMYANVFLQYFADSCSFLLIVLIQNLYGPVSAHVAVRYLHLTLDLIVTCLFHCDSVAMDPFSPRLPLENQC